MNHHLCLRVLTALIPFLIIGTNTHAAELHLLAGAGLRQPTDRLVAQFQQETGHKVYVEYGGSGSLMARIQASQKGDVFMPGAYFYIDKLTSAQQILSAAVVVLHTPVVAVNKTQAHRIQRFEDIARPGIKLALGDPKAMALGRTALEILEKSGLKTAISKNVTVYGATVKQLALYTVQGAVDASIIGRADAFQFADALVHYPVPAPYYTPVKIGVAVLATSQTPQAAEELKEYLSGSQGIQEFLKAGFLPVEAL